MKRPIILDTDIGDDIDDAFALALLLHADVDIKAITTVYRNSVQRARIVLKMLDIAGVCVDVYAGEDSPLHQPVFVASFETLGPEGKPNIPHYDETSMGDYRVPQLRATEGIARLLDRFPGELTLCGIGPMTNFATVCTEYPQSFCKAKEILLMGGELTGAFAEWNVLCDPEAFEIVLSSGVPVRMVTYEPTSRCILTKEDVQMFADSEREMNRLLYSMVQKWQTDSKRSHPPTIYDGLAVSALTEQFVQFQQVRRHVCLGKDGRGKLLEGGYVLQASVGADTDGFMRYLKEQLLN